MQTQFDPTFTDAHLPNRQLASLITRPQLILIDAAENLPQQSWHVLRDLMASPPPVAIVIASRDLRMWGDVGEPPEYRQLLENCGAVRNHATCRVGPAVAVSSVDLLPLTEASTAQLLANQMGVDVRLLQSEVVSKAYGTSGGNPRILLEYCARVALPGSSKGGDVNGAVLAALERLPVSVQDMVLAELDHLTIVQQVHNTSRFGRCRPDPL